MLQVGKEEYLNPLMRMYNSLLYRILLRFCKIQTDLEELIQDVWVKVFFKIKKLKNSEKFKVWVSKIAYNLGIDYLKRKSYNSTEKTDIYVNEDELYSFEEIQKIVWEEVKKLEIKYQMPIILYYFEHFTYPEIAKITRINENTVKSLIKRGKEKLKQNFQNRGLEKWNI